MMQHHNYKLEELNNMMPWEREVYTSMLKVHIETENEKMRNRNG
jgi:hypothetical protein